MIILPSNGDKKLNVTQMKILSRCCGVSGCFLVQKWKILSNLDEKHNYQQRQLANIDINALFSSGKRPISSIPEPVNKRLCLESDTLIISSEFISSSPQFPPSSAPQLLISDTTL